MIATIDAAGRIVVPKPLRKALGFGPGQALEMRVSDGRLEIGMPRGITGFRVRPEGVAIYRSGKGQ